MSERKRIRSLLKPSLVNGEKVLQGSSVSQMVRNVIEDYSVGNNAFGIATNTKDDFRLDVIFEVLDSIENLDNLHVGIIEETLLGYIHPDFFEFVKKLDISSDDPDYGKIYSYGSNYEILDINDLKGYLITDHTKHLLELALDKFFKVHDIVFCEIPTVEQMKENKVFYDIILSHLNSITLLVRHDHDSVDIDKYYNFCNRPGLEFKDLLEVS